MLTRPHPACMGTYQQTLIRQHPSCGRLAAYSGQVKAYDDQLVSWVDALPADLCEGSDDDGDNLGPSRSRTDEEEDEFDKVAELVADSGFGSSLGSALTKLGVECVMDLTLVSHEDLIKHGVAVVHARKFMHSVHTSTSEGSEVEGNRDEEVVEEEEFDKIAELVAESGLGPQLGSALTKLGVESIQDLSLISHTDLTKHGMAVVPAKKFLRNLVMSEPGLRDSMTLLRVEDVEEDEVDKVAELVAESGHGPQIGSALTELGVESMKDLDLITHGDLTEHGVAVVPAKKFLQRSRV